MGLWKWSESGNQLINVATGKPFSVGGFTEWRVARPNDGDILETQYGGKALDAWVARDNGCGGELIVGNTHGGAGQWFSLVPADQFVADPSLDCPPTRSRSTTPGQSETPLLRSSVERGRTLTRTNGASNQDLHLPEKRKYSSLVSVGRARRMC